MHWKSSTFRGNAVGNKHLSTWVSSLVYPFNIYFSRQKRRACLLQPVVAAIQKAGGVGGGSNKAWFTPPIVPNVGGPPKNAQAGPLTAVCNLPLSGSGTDIFLSHRHHFLARKEWNIINDRAIEDVYVYVYWLTTTPTKNLGMCRLAGREARAGAAFWLCSSGLLAFSWVVFDSRRQPLCIEWTCTPEEFDSLYIRWYPFGFYVFFQPGSGGCAAECIQSSSVICEYDKQ